MAERIDYLDDPAAPKANRLIPSANIIVVNDQDQILIIRRTDNGNWAVPGGAMDLGESIAEAAVRETRAEIGIVCEIMGLVGIYTCPGHFRGSSPEVECPRASPKRTGRRKRGRLKLCSSRSLRRTSCPNRT